MPVVTPARKFKKKQFVRDPRHPGWWATVIVEYLGAGANENIDEVLPFKIREALMTFCRYRIYYRELRVMLISVPEEHVEDLCDAMFMYRRIAPTPQHFEDNVIFCENLPYHNDLYEVLNTYFWNTDSAKVKPLANHSSPAKRTEYRFMNGLLTHVAKRILVDIPEEERRDRLMKRLCLTQFLGPNDRRCFAKKWAGYNNLNELRLKLEELCPRQGPRDPEIAVFFKLTKRKFLTFFKDHPALVARNGPQDESDDDEANFVPHDTSDNLPLRNCDVRKGRGMFVSGSGTYPNWKSDAVQQLEPQPQLLSQQHQHQVPHQTFVNMASHSRSNRRRF